MVLLLLILLSQFEYVFVDLGLEQLETALVLCEERCLGDEELSALFCGLDTLEVTKSLR